MRLEQRITFINDAQPTVKRIEPGQSIRSRFRIIETDILLPEGHAEFDIKIKVSCAKNNPKGRISLVNPISKTHETRDILPGDLPMLKIRKKDGSFGHVEWQLIQEQN